MYEAKAAFFCLWSRRRPKSVGAGVGPGTSNFRRRAGAANKSAGSAKLVVSQLKGILTYCTWYRLVTGVLSSCLAGERIAGLDWLGERPFFCVPA